MPVSTLGDPPVFALRWLYVLGCACSSCLGVGLLYLILLSPFGFTWGGFVGVGVVIMTGLNCGECLGALYGLLLSNFRASSVSQRFVSFFLEKILTSCCKDTCFLWPISLIGVVCEGFSKKFLYWRIPLWWHLLLTWGAFWLIVKKATLSADRSALVFGV